MDSRPSMPQENLKRSVELDASIIIPQFNKKLKTEDIIEPDVKQVETYLLVAQLLHNFKLRLCVLFLFG